MRVPWVAIQRNPRSGSGRRRRHLVELCSSLRSHGLVPRLFSEREKLDERVSVPEARETLVAIVAAGGDGTVGDLINRHPGLRLAVLPMGTENLLARYLGIGCSGPRVAEIIAEGHTRRIDLGRAGERLFALVASCGIDAEIARRVDQRRGGNITHLTYLQPIWSALRNYKYPRLRAYVDGGSEPLEGAEVMVSNLPAYGLKLKVGATAVENDGKFAVTVLQRGSAFQMIRYFYKLARGTHELAADVQVVPASRVRVEADMEVPVQIDGDPAGVTPVVFECLPGELEVFAPVPAGGHAGA